MILHYELCEYLKVYWLEIKSYLNWTKLIWKWDIELRCENEQWESWVQETDNDKVYEIVFDNMKCCKNEKWK